MTPKYQFLFLRCIIPLLLISGCRDSVNDAEETAAAEVKTEVGITHPSFQNIAEHIDLNGVTVIQKKDNIRSNNTGYITSMKFKIGDFIKKGDVFCTIQTKEQDALQELYAADTALHKFQKQITVVANASGLITAINILQGDYVGEGDIIANISEPASLITQVNVPFEYRALAGVGKACQIILPDGKSIQTTISGNMPTVDPASQSQAYFIRLPGQALPENLNVIIRLTNHQKNNTLCVPTLAIQTDEMQQEFWVMKVVDDSIAVKTPVKIGLQNDIWTELLMSPISTTDVIITQGAYGLEDSTFVKYQR